MIKIFDYIAAWRTSEFRGCQAAPWSVTSNAESMVAEVILALDASYRVHDGVAVHRTATVESGAVVKPPALIGPKAFVAANAYLRGGVYLGEGCIVGPSCELKSTFMFGGAKIAHLSFVGDSLLGSGVNVEAGAIIANYRNELDEKRIRIRWKEQTLDTGVEKFGSLIGDAARVGANSVIAPGAIIAPGERIPRLTLVDQRAPVVPPR